MRHALLRDRRHPPRVADRGLGERRAVRVHLERQLVAHPRVGRVALVLVGDRLQLVGQVHGVPPRPGRLEHGHVVAVLGHRVRQRRSARTVVGVQLGAQRTSRSRAQPLAVLPARGRPEFRRAQRHGRGVAAEGIGEHVEPGPDVEPVARTHRRQVVRARCVRAGIRLGVGAFDHPEAAVLALDPVVVPVPVPVAARGTRPGDRVRRRRARDHPHRGRQSRHPRRPGQAVGQVVLRRGRVLHDRLGPGVVAHQPQQPGLPAREPGIGRVDAFGRPARQVHVAHRRARHRRGPHQARRAGAQDVRDGDGGEAVDRGQQVDPRLGAEPVAGLVHPVPHRVGPRYSRSEVPEPSRSAQRTRRGSNRSTVSNCGAASITTLPPKRPWPRFGQ